MTREHIRTAALAMQPDDRAALADELMLSLAPIADREVELAWGREAESRVAAFERGELRAFDVEDVLAEAHRKLEI